MEIDVQRLFATIGAQKVEIDVLRERIQSLERQLQAQDDVRQVEPEDHKH